MEVVDLKKPTLRSRWNRLRILLAAVQAFRAQRFAATPLFHNLEIKSIINVSNSGKVYKVVDQLSGETYALKEFIGISYTEEITHEIEILKKLNHPNLVKCYQIYHVNNTIYLLLEPLDREYLAGVSITSEFDLSRLGYQVLLGLRYLHQNHFWHGDITPSNIFVDHLEQVKVLFPGKTLTNIRSNAMADIHDRFSWDIWSVGLCILKLSKGLNWPSNDFKFDLVPVPTSSRHKRRNPSIELWRFLLSCMKTKRDKAKRITADELIRHPFFYQHVLSKEKGNLQAGFLSLAPPIPDEWELQAEHLSFSPTLSYEKDFSCEIGSLYHADAASYEKNFFVDDVSALHAGTTSYEEDFFAGNLGFSAAACPPSREFSFKPVLGSISSAALSEVTTCEGKEQSSPRKKKPKLSVKDEDSIDDGRLKDPRHHKHFQRCIEHCTLFLPDCEFEKDKLVQMWIADNCIAFEVTKRMEDVANSYFDALVNEELIVPSKFDHLYRRMKYRVNAAKASTWPFKEGHYVRVDTANSAEICEVVLHLTYQCKTLDRALSAALKNLKQLRTLVMIDEDCSGLIKQLPNDIFLGLKLLRTLDLSRSHISELPGSIGVLESLQFLDISETPVKQLPESMDRLSLLQTLKLKGCFGLSALPRGLGRLINLRHLDLDVVSQLKSMPRGMGNLKQLQTLRAFLVGKNDGCGIMELKNMNEITGSFCISNLENVLNAEEAKAAALGDKKHIEALELRWHNHVNEDCQDTTEILEYLRPHFQLRELQLTFYRGSKLPSWISNPSFTDLSSITLYKCINCDILPSIGELPSLKSLHIVDMNNVTNINTLFCRNYGTQGSNAFPRLEKLTIDNMLNLEEWSGLEDGDFPCLRHFAIRYCPKLQLLPSLSHLVSLQHLEICHCAQLISLPEGLFPGSLESLIIRGCPKINERCTKDEGPDWSKIASVQNIWIDFDKISLD